jgi:heptosyltransferase-2
VTEILIIKTAALGDVLRTTSILPGLRNAHPGARITWITAPAAVDLVRTHPLVARVEPLDAQRASDVVALAARMAKTRFERVISLDDEESLCRLASTVSSVKLSGAYVAAGAQGGGRRAYTADVAPWFDMGLLSVHGKARADELKILNRKSQPQIYAEMLGIAMGKPELHLTPEAERFGRAFVERHALGHGAVVVGLNTGAGGRWISKQLSVERTIELARLVDERLRGPVASHGSVRSARFVVMGGEAEVDRNRAILEGLRACGLGACTIDAGCSNPLLEFAAIVGACDVMVTSDSLALHMAIALDVRVVAFFAPTSAAEIELYGLGEKVQSTAGDYCSYKPDADNSSITAERLADALLRQIDRAG